MNTKFIHLLYVPTMACNMQCRYCYLEDHTVDTLRGGDCLETLQYAIAKFREADVVPFNISLHGGEVTTLPKQEFHDLIQYISRYYQDMRELITLTKRMAEDLTDYMKEVGIRVKYLHSDIDTLERAQIIRDMRLDVFDVLVGINLLREGLDIPEITLVAILDADKEGFLRSATSLIQTIGRAARNAEGHVIMYADTITDSMREALDETNRRREIQMKYNEEHGITPQTIKKAVRDLISISKVIAKEEVRFEKDPESMTKKELEKLIGEIQKKMQKAAADLNFEAAAELRDKMLELKKQLNDME